MDYLAGFILGVIASGFAWAIWPCPSTRAGENLADMAAVIDRHERTLGYHEERIRDLERKL